MTGSHRQVFLNDHVGSQSEVTGMFISLLLFKKVGLPKIETKITTELLVLLFEGFFCSQFM